MPESASLATVPTTGLDLAPAISQAVALGKDGVEVLERLHAIHKEEREFRARGEFALAMTALKADLPPVVKSVAGQHGASRAGTRTKGLYAPLDTICAVLDPLTARYGFSYRFDREMRDGKEWVMCHVTHKGGHTETTRYPAMDDDPGKGKSPLHARGSGDTYARRYVLTAAFAIVTADPDDDGNAASEPRRSEPADEGAVANVVALLDEAPDPAGEKRRLLDWVSKAAKRPIASVGAMTAPMLSAAIKKLDERREAGWPS